VWIPHGACGFSAGRYPSARNISFVLNDGAANSTAATKTVSVAAVNDAPVAQNGSASGNEDTVIAGSAVATDVDMRRARGCASDRVIPLAWPRRSPQ
jgi:hypothetical protein